MDRKLTEFVALLRSNGVAVSPAEMTDAAAVAEAVGFSQRNSFKQGLGLALAKSQRDKAVFADCFDRFFQFADFSPSSTPDSQPSPTAVPAAVGNGPMSGSGGSSGGMAGEPMSPLAEALLSENEIDLQVALANAIEAVQLQNIRVITQQGLFGRRLMQDMGLEALDADISRLDASARSGDRQQAAVLRARRENLRQQVRQTVQRYFQLVRQRQDDQALQEIPLASLTEQAKIRQVISRMARRLVALHGRRKKVSQRGVLDLRHTLRTNMGYGGLVVKPVWRRRKKDRPKVMAICDVSGSVSRYSRFLLMFLYSLQEIIPRTRAFVFSSSLGEVTPLFASQDVNTALDDIMSIWGMGSTDYGRSFKDFAALALDDIDRHTTLIILGDARNNRGDPQLPLLRAISGRAKQVLWINPEAENRWGSGDSEMLRYRSCCTRAVSCGTLGQLERAVNWMLLRS